MADSKVTALTSAGPLDGTETFYVVKAGSKKGLVSSILDYIKTALAPSDNLYYQLRNGGTRALNPGFYGYVVNRWFANDIGLSLGNGTALNASVMYFFPLMIWEKVTISDLTATITTAVAASNFQLAIYGMDPVTKQPNGAALTSTGSMSGATATSVSSTLSSPLTLDPGLYWGAVSSDAAVAVSSSAATQICMQNYAGAASMASVMSPTLVGRVTFTFPATFGTWPTVTAGSFTENTTRNCPAMGFKVSGVF